MHADRRQALAVPGGGTGHDLDGLVALTVPLGQCHAMPLAATQVDIVLSFGCRSSLRRGRHARAECCEAGSYEAASSRKRVMTLNSWRRAASSNSRAARLLSATGTLGPFGHRRLAIDSNCRARSVSLLKRVYVGDNSARTAPASNREAVPSNGSPTVSATPAPRIASEVAGDVTNKIGYLPNIDQGIGLAR